MNEKKLNSPGRLRALSFRDAAILVCIARAYMNLRRHLVGILLTDASASRRTHFRLAVFDYRSIARVFQMYPFGYSRTEEVKPSRLFVGAQQSQVWQKGEIFLVVSMLCNATRQCNLFFLDGSTVC